MLETGTFWRTITVTNWPGSKMRPGLGKTARAVTVSVARSTLGAR